MKKIGKGFYYWVYDIGNGRVQKRITSWWYRVQKLIEWGRVEKMGILNIISPLTDRRRVRSSIMQSKSVFKFLDPEECGNPVFINELEYEQDKVITLDTILPTVSDEHFLSLIKQYVMFQKKLWSIGFSDSVFNFRINQGVSEKTHNLVCIDFNEFTESKEKVVSDILSKKWKTQSSLKWFPENRSQLKESILALFDQEFTIEALDAHWKNKNI